MLYVTEEMLSKVKCFLNRNRQKFVLGSLIISGTVFIVHYTQRKLREFQEKEAREMFERTKRRQYYDSTERTCNQMISSLAVTLRASVVNALDTESFVSELKNKSCNKIITWNELKVIAIARSAAIIYANVMLVTLLRIQVNLMSGYMFKDSENSCNTLKTNSIIKTRYMSLSSHFMENGVQQLCDIICNKVKNITSTVSLKDELTLRDVEQIYWAIVSSVSADIENDPIKNVAQYMLLATCEESNEPVLIKMSNETLDLLESEEVQNLMRSSISNGFVLLIDHISEYFVNSPKAVNGCSSQSGLTIHEKMNFEGNTTTHIKKFSNCKTQSSFIDFNTASMPMAKIIPIINGQVPANPVLKDVPSDWLQCLLLNDNLKTLGANVYEAFSF